MAIISRWRAHARQVIKQVLEELPDDASLQEVRRVLREAYPFGERQMHPYRCWCAEQRAAIKRRFPDMAKKEKSAPNLPNYSLALIYLPRIHKTRLLELFAPCHWCNSRGCIICNRRRINCDAINDNPLFKEMAQATLDGDALARLAIADWLSDQLNELVAVTW